MKCKSLEETIQGYFNYNRCVLLLLFWNVQVISGVYTVLADGAMVEAVGISSK